ncbi:MAG: metallopeptidase family protein [Actinomycetes bacterium]
MRSGRRARRDRRGRGLRAPLVRPFVDVGGSVVRVPAAPTPSARFDDLVHESVERLEQRWADDLRGVEFAVVDVPHVPPGFDATADADVVADETAGGAVPLGRLVPARLGPRGEATPARVVLYRRPLEARASSRTELAELVHDVVVDQIARLLGRSPDEIDPQDD